MTPSSSNTSQSQIDLGRYKRAKKSSQVIQTPVPIQTNKESDSETETEIWSFDRAINEVFRLLPAVMS